MLLSISSSVGALAFTALAGVLLPRESLRVIHDGSREERPIGVVVRRGVLEVYGRSGRLLVWDLDLGAPAATDDAPPQIEVGDHDRLLFAALGDSPARVEWSRAESDGPHWVLERAAGVQKSVRLDEAHALGLVLSEDGSTAAAYAIDALPVVPGRLFLADLERGLLLARVTTPPIEQISISAAGERVLVRGAQDVAVYDRTGTARLQLGKGRAAWLSRSGKLAALLRESAVHFFEGDQELSAVRVGSFVGDVAFAEGARRAAIADGARVALVAIDTGELIASIAAPRADARFHSVDLIDDGSRLAAGGVSLPDGLKTRLPVEAFVLHWVRETGTRGVSTLRLESWSIDTPDVRFLAGQTELLVRAPLAIALLEPGVR